MRVLPLAIGAVALLASVGLLADDPKLVLLQDTRGPKRIDHSPRYTRSQQLLIHHRNRHRAAAAAPAVSQDVGDVAVIVDNGAIIVPPTTLNAFDLDSRNIVFTPAPGGFSVASAAPGLDANFGGTLPLTDDDSEEVPLGFAFSFFGTTYTSAWVNSDGNLTFGAGDSSSDPRDAARLIGGAPRIAPLLDDLNPEAGGTVHARLEAGTAVFTWNGVPEFGAVNANTFQVTLRSNGSITMAYASMDAQFGVAGVAQGNDQGPLNEIDYTAALPATFAAGAIFEDFHAAHGTLVDVQQLAREFYRTHDDDFDFLATYTDFFPDLGGTIFAFSLTLHNQTAGIGRPIYDLSADYGSAGELETVLMMNSIDLYWSDEANLVDPPIQKFVFPGLASIVGPPGKNQFSRRARLMGTAAGHPVWGPGSFSIGLISPMAVLAHETLHRWAAFVPFVHPTKGIGADSFDLLSSADRAHWGYMTNVTVPSAQFGGDTRSSALQGNAIVDLGGNFFCVNPGERSFLTARDELMDGYTALDQYLMGVRPANEVGQFWYVDEPTSPITGTSYEFLSPFLPVDDVGICGKRVNLTVQNIQDYPGIGPRVPAIGDEVDHDAGGNPQLDRKTMAFILLVAEGDPGAHTSAISRVDNFRRGFLAYGNGPATGGRGRFDTVLRPAIH